MATVIRELLVRFGVKADSKPLQNFEKRVEASTDALRQAGDAARRFGDAVKTGLQAAAVGAAGAIGLSTKAIVDQGFETQKLASQLGITNEEFQRLAFAAELAGEDAQTLHDAMQTLGERFNDAIIDPASDAAVQLKQLGLDITESAVRQKDASQLWMEYADALMAIEDPVQRSARAMTLLGDDGVRLINTMRGGSEQLKDLGDRAEAVGAVMDTETVTQMNRMREEMFFLRKQAQFFQIELAKRVVPALSRAAVKVGDWLEKVRIGPALLEKMKLAAKLAGVVVASIVGAKVLSGFGLLTKVIIQGALAFRRMGVMAAAAQLKVLAIPIAIGAIILLLQDMHVWLKGGDSLTGRFVDKWKEAPGVMGDVARALERAKPALESLMLDPRSGLATMGDKFRESLGQVVDFFMGTVLPVIQMFRAQWQEIVAEFAPPMIDAFMEMNEAIFGTAEDTIPALKDAMFVLFKAVRLVVKLFVKSWIVSFKVIAAAMRVVVPIVVAVIKVIVDLFNRLLPVVTVIIDKIVDVFDAFIDDAMPVISDFFRDFHKFFDEAVAFVMRWAPRIIEPIKAFAMGAIALVGGIIAGMTSAWETFRTSVWGPFWELMQGPIDGIKAVIDGLGAGLDSAISSAKNVVGIVGEAVDGLKSFLGLEEKRERIKREGFTISGTRERSAEQLAAEFQAARAARGAGSALAGGISNTINGGISVTIEGSTGMGPQDTSRAVQDGTTKALDQAAREASNG